MASERLPSPAPTSDYRARQDAQVEKQTREQIAYCEARERERLNDWTVPAPPADDWSAL